MPVILSDAKNLLFSDRAKTAQDDNSLKWITLSTFLR